MGNFAVLSDFQIWVCTFAMLIGRLELLTVLVLSRRFSGGNRPRPSARGPFWPEIDR